MDYNKITGLQKQRKVSNRKIAKSIGLTDVGYGKMLNNNSCDVKTIEAIAKFFKVPVTYFFDEQVQNEFNEKSESYLITRINCLECIKKKERIDELEYFVGVQKSLIEQLQGGCGCKKENLSETGT